MGYVLPWGQMSFWGATVITNLFSAIPYIGMDFTYWLWGGFSVDNATLSRFFALHFVLPFVILGLVLLHLILLHIVGSSHPLKIIEHPDKIPFYPYFYYKDLYSLLLILSFFLFFVFFYPNYLGHSDNYIEANPLSTPTHIVPEWYFLPYYAILRSIPSKLGGVFMMAMSLLALIILSFDFKNLRQGSHFSLYPTLPSDLRLDTNIIILVFISVFILLGWLGGQVVEYPFLELGRYTTALYFILLGYLFLTPIQDILIIIVAKRVTFYYNKINFIVKRFYS
jgi:quinol-cytochrome oxidoreductase complex cytochrome b subunit